ncbi:MAG: pilus assembly PilX family protein [Steroidobacteraceae bacterium]
MRAPVGRGGHRQAGLVLISSLLLLLILTILAVSMFRSVGIQEKIAGNYREKERATLAAEEAEQYAEWWLTSSGYYTGGEYPCNSLVDANTAPQSVEVCSNPAPTSFDAGSVAVVPWQIGGVDVGVTYQPTGMVLSTDGGTGGGMGTYVQPPVFYISQLLKCADNPNNTCFQIDAIGYGGTSDAVSEVESTYELVNGGGSGGNGAGGIGGLE